MAIAIDKTQWSKSSQNSYGGHYDEKACCYENIAYRCKKCFAACVFTAEAQKAAYEVQKRFITWVPSLCDACRTELERLLAEERQCQARWNSERAALQADRVFMQRWLFVLKEISTYGKRANSSMLAMLASRIADAPSPEDS